MRTNNDGKKVWFLDKIDDIREAIQNEFDLYDNMKSEKKETNKIKKRARNANDAKKRQEVKDLASLINNPEKREELMNDETVTMDL